jgi:hypothetical protein
MKGRSTIQLSYAQIPRRRVSVMDLKEVFRFVAPRVRDAAVKTAGQLNLLGIRYALAGGLAVGAHGYVRATSDVEFLVGDEAFEHQGSLVAFKAGVPTPTGRSQEACSRVWRLHESSLCIHP